MKNRKPLWATGPCPAWCREGHEHQQHPDDRVHYRWGIVSVELSTDDLIKTGTDREGLPTYAAPEVTVDLAQGWREVSPRVILNQERGWPTSHEMTLDEAETIANGLLAAVRAGRGESR